jgi:hypothetical protein
MNEKHDNSGILFKNDRKREGRNDPDYNGSCTIAGQEFWMNAWLKDGRKGKFMSFSFKPKESKQDQQPASEPPAAESDNQDVPF